MGEVSRVSALHLGFLCVFFCVSVLLRGLARKGMEIRALPVCQKEETRKKEKKLKPGKKKKKRKQRRMSCICE